MKSMDLEQFTSLSKRLLDFGESITPENQAEDIRSPAYQEAYERLQRALADFGGDSSNIAKLDLMLNAMDRYQAANEMLRFKLQAKLAQQLDKS